MLSEVLIVMLVVMVSSQSSTLWTSLLLIPFSVMVALTLMSCNVMSGLSMILFIMVFIGGLMVLLVSVSSISIHEQSYNFEKTWLLASSGILAPFFFLYKIYIGSESLLTVNWVSEQSALFILLVFVILISLLLVSSNVNIFKGLVRST